MKIKDLFKAIFSDQLETEIDPKIMHLSLQFPTESGDAVLEVESLEVGQPVSLIDADGNSTTPEDGDYEITDETGNVNVVTIASGSITDIQPGSSDTAQESPNETNLAKDPKAPVPTTPAPTAPATGDPVEDHPKVKEAKEKLELARANARVEAAKCAADALKGKKKDDAPVEVDEKAKPAGTENPDEAKKPKKMAKKLATEGPKESEPKAPKEKGGFQIEDEKAKGTKVDEGTKAAPKEGSVGNKSATTKLSKAERLRLEMAEEKAEKVNVTLSAEEELKKVKGELALAQEKIKVIMSESKPLKVTQTTIMDKTITSDQKLSKSEFIKKHILGREDV